MNTFESGLDPCKASSPAINYLLGIIAIINTEEGIKQEAGGGGMQVALWEYVKWLYDMPSRQQVLM